MGDPTSHHITMLELPRLAFRRAHSAGSITLAGLLALSTVAAAQTLSALPATPPTATPAANTLPAPIVATADGGAPRRRAKVTYTVGLLNVQANNSSLNGILRDIAQATGMKITGGVADQRVFGNYGPAEPSTILATLLDGTGSNILLRERADNAPAELILTPRNGGVTPPNPNAAGFDGGREDDDDQSAPPPQAQQTQPLLRPSTLPSGSQQPATSGPPSIPQPFNNVLGSSLNSTPSASTLPTVNSIPTDSLATPSTAVPVRGIVDSVNPVPPGSTSFATPTVPTSVTSDGTTTSGAKTPEQIFQQLQQMRQQSTQPQQGSGSSNPTNSTAPNPQ